MLFTDKSAAAGALIKAPSRAPGVLVLTESFWGSVARLSASRWVGGVSSDVDPVDNPSWGKPLFKDAEVKGDLASVQLA